MFTKLGSRWFHGQRQSWKIYEGTYNILTIKIWQKFYSLGKAKANLTLFPSSRCHLGNPQPIFLYFRHCLARNLCNLSLSGENYGKGLKFNSVSLFLFSDRIFYFCKFYWSKCKCFLIKAARDRSQSLPSPNPRHLRQFRLLRLRNTFTRLDLKYKINPSYVWFSQLTRRF